MLKHIEIEARPGEVVALLGATGSGKSTITLLLPRFYDVSSGRITVDGHDIRDVTIHSLRKEIGIVLQDSFLFSATVRDNISYGSDEYSEKQIVEAARVAGINYVQGHLLARPGEVSKLKLRASARCALNVA